MFNARLLDTNKAGGKTSDFVNTLKSMVIGQDHVIDSMTKAYQEIMCGLATPGRPYHNFLFLGPTGVGKTHVVESLAKFLFGTTVAVTKVDCAEFQHSHEISKLIGSPPGYLGHRETHPMLSQERIDTFKTDGTPISLVLFDEIEKSSDSLWQLLLGILDKATLTLGDNRRVDFSTTIIFMTSNLGASEIAKRMEGGYGFIKNQRVASGAFHHIALEAAKRKFSPEFINRLDTVVTFNPLSEADISKILELELNYLQDRVVNSKVAFHINVSDTAKQALVSDGYDSKYGARHLKRSLAKNIVPMIAAVIDSGQVMPGDVTLVDYDTKFEMRLIKNAKPVFKDHLQDDDAA